MNTVVNYLETKNDDTVAVVFTTSKKEAEAYLGYAGDLGEVAVFCPSQGDVNSCVYFTALSAIRTSIVKKVKERRNVLLVFEGVKEVLTAMYGISDDLGFDNVSDFE